MEECGPVELSPFPSLVGADAADAAPSAVSALEAPEPPDVMTVDELVTRVVEVVDQVVGVDDELSSAAEAVEERLRSMRWPSAATIRAAAAALDSGDTLSLAGRRLRYVCQFFGLSLLPKPADVTPRQWAARQNWVRRREVFGANGFSAKGEHALRLNLVQAAIVKQRAPKATHCRRGHKWTAENARVTAKGRSCRTCERLVRAERARKKLAARKAETVLAELRQRMIELGIQSHRNPTSQYWRQRYVAIRQRWRALKRELEPYLS